MLPTNHHVITARVLARDFVLAGIWFFFFFHGCTRVINYFISSYLRNHYSSRFHVIIVLAEPPPPLQNVLSNAHHNQYMINQYMDARHYHQDTKKQKLNKHKTQQNIHTYVATTFRTTRVQKNKKQNKHKTKHNKIYVRSKVLPAPPCSCAGGATTGSALS